MSDQLKGMVQERRTTAQPESMHVDVCVVGAGIAGVSAAIEAARAGRTVALVDVRTSLGGQSVHAMIGTFCGLYGNGPSPQRIIHGIADEFLPALIDAGDAHVMTGRRNTAVVQYRVDAFARWIDHAVQDAGIITVLGAVVIDAVSEDARLTSIEVAHRTSRVRIHAQGFIDASGDANLSWIAGLPTHRPAEEIYGSTMITLEGVKEQALAALPAGAIAARLQHTAAQHGLVRHDGFAFMFPGSGETLVNMTHFPTPFGATATAEMEWEGRRQADALIGALRTEFPDVFAHSRIRRYGEAGTRQTRSIAGRHTLTVSEVRKAVRFADAAARCSWPIEVHDSAERATWEIFDDDHIHEVPLRSLLSFEVDNLVAAGRCIDAEPLALASVRVMGTCVATGRAAAVALHLTLGNAVQDIDLTAFRECLKDNLENQEGGYTPAEEGVLS